MERGGAPLKGYWSLPGGLVETGESLDEAVRREVLEETGLRVQPVEMLGIFERIMRDAKGRAEYHYVLADYICKVVGGTLKAGDDVARVEWVTQSVDTLTENCCQVEGHLHDRPKFYLAPIDHAIRRRL